MIKFVLLAKRKSGMSREAFMDYYENNHVPLIRRIFPEASKCHVRMNFIDQDKVIYPHEFSGEVEFDVVTESIWQDQETLDRFLKATTNSDLLTELIEDEKNMFDRDSMRFVTVDVREVAPV